MRHNSSITTMAAALALALALLVGVLLPSDSVVHAADPVFENTSDPITREVPENTPPGVNIGDPVSATDDDDDGENNNDIEFGDTLTYSLGGTDAASFDIDASTGQLITKAPLDFENPSGGTGNDNNIYEVTVTVKDSSGTSVMRAVTITVTNVEEFPGEVAAPTVVSTDTNGGTDYELKVIWHPPDNTVDAITGYSVQYKKTTEASFTDDDHADTTTTTTIAALDVDTSYQVRVRATNIRGNGPWSLSSVGSTNKKDNALPMFTDGDTVTRNVFENSDPGVVVGSRVSATDNDHILPLAYRLHGPDANSFDLQASTGQIRTKRGVVYDFETKDTLNVTMTVSDGQGGTDAIAVTINVTDVPEIPSRPDRPTVRATQGNSRSLDVSWKSPDNTGPAITGYDLRYREGSSGSFRPVISLTGTGTTHTIAPEDANLNDGDDRLKPGASYEVYVRAKSLEAPNGGDWSAAGTGRTSAGNDEPVFDDRDDVTRDNNGDLPDYITTRTVAENTRPGQSVGRPVRANDGNGDTRTYRLFAAPSPNEAHVSNFDINESTGQILTKEPLNHEAECSDGDLGLPGGHLQNCTYTVKVQVWDGRDTHRKEQDATTILSDDNDANDATVIDDTITVTITVSDVVEKPAAPAVTVTSPEVVTGATAATLTVAWDRPENTGPPITGHVVQCTGDGITTTSPCPQPTDSDITDENALTQTYTMTLTPSDLTRLNSYRVRVRADNNEGEGAWSSWVTQSTSKEGNSLPEFSTTPPDTVYVEENASLVQQPVFTDINNPTTSVASLQGNDTDGDTPTLRLEGPGAARFGIDSTGQIKTKSKRNHEDPECDYNNEVSPTVCSYVVRVKLSDPDGGSISHRLTIRVTDADEPPDAPAAPRVTATSGSGWSLGVMWNAPRNDGPPITGYEIRYRKHGTTLCRKDGTAPWCQLTHTGTERKATIKTIPNDDNTAQVHLEPRTQYEVQVRGLNGEGNSTFANATNWSNSGRGTTGASNERPVFDSELPTVVVLEVEENTRSGQNVGSAIEATDPDKHRLTYTLEGPGKDSFTITSAGQIRTRSPLNHEERDEYSVTVKVNDGQRKNNSVAAKPVTIKVTDRPEQPSKPAPPKVAGIPGSTDSVRVTWDEPANPGPPITHYSLQYAVSGSRDAFLRVTIPSGNADKSAVITGLTAGTRYEVQVRAETPEHPSDWSNSGTGSPNPDVENTRPAFSTRSHSFSVAENTPPGTDVGDLVAALDPDGDTLTYSLEGVDADSFDIIATNSAGQIQTKAALNFEEKARYSVAVRVRDGRGGTDAVNVTINVTDDNTEAPDTPFAPTVTALSSTSVQASWDAPDNQGPPITDYDYRYKAVADPNWTEVTNTTITATTATIDGLTASTSYDVEVRAKNAEGTSDWSNPGNGATNAPGANNPPVFTDGTTATRSVSATSPAGTNIGLPVAATDADAGDTITYSHEGRDAPSFDIDSTSGQLSTKSGITLIVGTTYTVTVVADDTKDTTRIDVSIEATAAPPNNPPVFSDGASTTRTVRDDATAGRNVGSPVTATDADTGDTITYSLEGTDAASFGIVASSGQIQTSAALDANTKSTYSVTVRATDNNGGSATIAVAITVTAAPATYGCATLGAVTDTSNTGLVADCEALMASRNLLEGNTGRLNWAPTRPINQWEGVFLSGTPSRVTMVVLRRYGLDGTVPADLGRLPMLRQLNLHSNNLTGSIPPELNGLSRLERLLLHNNRLSGPIPNLSSLSNLTWLWLSGRDMALTGNVPSWLNSMSGLESLSLWGNDLSGPVPVLTGMTSLRDLKLQSNNLSGGVPAWFGDMNGPANLYLHDNQLTGTIPANLGRNTGVIRLWLDRNNLSGSIPAALGRMTGLRTLNLRDNQLTGAIPSELGNLSSLQQLRLHNNQLTGTIPSELGNLSSLTQMWLSGNQLTGSIPASLGGMPRLRDLNLRANNLSGDIPVELGNLRNTLTRLRIGGTQVKDENGVVISEVRGNTGLTGCVPAQLSGATDAADLRLAGPPGGLSFC